MFTKRIADLNPSDLERAWQEKWSESSNLEFKRSIPTENGKPDRWILKADRIGDYGKQKLLREIVAFANAHGGILIIGIDETDEKPARADKPIFLPNCEEFAERFRRTLREEVDPRLIAVECEGIPFSGSDGLVVVRVPSSPVGPHWVRSSRDPTFRRGDESVTMTMTEIQDLTLRLTRAIDERNALLSKAKDDFCAEFSQAAPRYLANLKELSNRRGQETSNSVIGVRCTAIPTVRFLFDRVATRPELRATAFPRIVAQDLNGTETELVKPAVWRTDDWRPRFRAAKVEEHDEYSISWNATIEVKWIHAFRGGALFLGWLLNSVAMTTTHVEQVLRAESALDVPYALDIHVCTLGRVAAGWHEHNLSSHALPSEIQLPLLAIGNDDAHQAVFRTVQYDCWTAAGVGNAEIYDVMLK